MNNRFVLLGLIKNELVKFFSKKIVFVVFLVILTGVFGYALSLKTSEEEINTIDWKKYLENEIESNKEILNDPSVGMNDEMRVTTLHDIQVYQYMIDHNIKPLKIHSASNMILSMNKLFALIVIIAIVLAGKILSDEFTDNTIQNLLAVPCERWKIFLSKIITLIVSNITLILILYLVSMCVGWIFFGFDGFHNKVVCYIDGKIIERNVLLQFFTLNFYNVMTLMVCSFLTILITLLFKNGIISTCSSIIVYLLGTQIAFALKDYSWIKYTLFANINFQIYLDGVEIIEGITTGFSLLVIAVHMIVFLALSFRIFTSRRLTL